jgi:putative membrane protein
MTIHTLVRGAALLAMLIVPLTATADKKGAPRLTNADLAILAHYNQVDLTEIEFGNLAQKKGTEKGIRMYGAMLVHDHSANDRQLVAFAKRQHSYIPKEVPTNDAERVQMRQTQDAIANIATFREQDFDLAFLGLMVSGHEKELANFDANVARIDNPGLKQLVVGMRPMLQMHLARAKELQKANNPELSSR